VALLSAVKSGGAAVSMVDTIDPRLGKRVREIHENALTKSYSVKPDALLPKPKELINRVGKHIELVR